MEDKGAAASDVEVTGGEGEGKCMSQPAIGQQLSQKSVKEHLLQCVANIRQGPCLPD